MAWYDFIYNWVLEKLSPIWDWVTDIWEKLYDLYYKARDYAYGLYRTARDLVYDKYEDAKAYARGLLEDISFVIPQWIRDAANSVIGWWDKVTSYVVAATTGIRTWITEQLDTLNDILNVIKGDITNLPELINTKISEFWNSVKDTIKVIIPQPILDAVNWIEDVGLPAVNDFLDRFPALFEDFYHFITHPKGIVEEGVISIIEGFVPSEEEINEKFKEELPLPV